LLRIVLNAVFTCVGVFASSFASYFASAPTTTNRTTTLYQLLRLQVDKLAYTTVVILLMIVLITDYCYWWC